MKLQHQLEPLLMSRLLLSLFLLLPFATLAQERALTREGNDTYEEDPAEAEILYRKAREADSTFVQSTFNLGDALYQQERYEESAAQFEQAAELAEEPQTRAKAHYNRGNALLKSNKLQESVEAYKESLRLDPGNEEAKYNLAYALQKLQQHKKQQQKQQQQEQNQQPQEQEEQQEEQQGQGDEEQQQPQQGEEKEEQPQPEITREQAKQLLDALQQEEQKVQRKMLREKEGERQPPPGGKDW